MGLTLIVFFKVPQSRICHFPKIGTPPLAKSRTGCPVSTQVSGGACGNLDGIGNWHCIGVAIVAGYG